MATAEQDSPLTLIEGIGPAAAQAFAGFGAHYVFDLLRASPSQLRDGLDGFASIERVERWRAMAALLQVASITNQWAEALVDAGIDSIEALHDADGDELDAAFHTAVAGGTIAAAPAADELADIRSSAAAHAMGGAVNVTVLDDASTPIPGATVRGGIRRERTNAHGRARLTRLQRGTFIRLVVTHADHATATYDMSNTASDENATGTVIIRLQSSPGVAPARLSEYDGDALPPLSVHAMTTEARSESELRNGDVLMLRRFYSDGDVQLTSKFLEYEDGIFLAISFRVSPDRLPDDVDRGDHFLFRRGELMPTPMNSNRLDIHRAMRQARRAMESMAPPETLAERLGWTEQLMAEMSSRRSWKPQPAEVVQ